MTVIPRTSPLPCLHSSRDEDSCSQAKNRDRDCVRVRITAAQITVLASHGRARGARLVQDLSSARRRITVVLPNTFVAGESRFGGAESRFRSQFFSGQENTSLASAMHALRVLPANEALFKSSRYHSSGCKYYTVLP